MFPTWLCADSDESSADSEVSSASSTVKRVVDVEKTGGGGEKDKNGAQEGVSADLIIVIFFSTNIICDICDKYELWVSAGLVLKALRESKIALLFFQLIWTWGPQKYNGQRCFTSLFFCKHKQMGLNEIIYL